MTVSAPFCKAAKDIGWDTLLSTGILPKRMDGELGELNNGLSENEVKCRPFILLYAFAGHTFAVLTLGNGQRLV